MSDSNGNASSGGIGFGGLLAVAFITLKLAGIIDWSWWWVLSPLWIPVTVALLILGIGVLATVTFGRKRCDHHHKIVERVE